MTMGELGRPVERLREKMKKLRLHSAKVVMLEQQLAMAEERMRRLESEKQARAEQAERSVSIHLLVAFLLQEFHHILLYKLLTYSRELHLRIKILMH